MVPREPLNSARVPSAALRPLGFGLVRGARLVVADVPSRKAIPPLILRLPNASLPVPRNGPCLSGEIVIPNKPSLRPVIADA